MRMASAHRRPVRNTPRPRAAIPYTCVALLLLGASAARADLTQVYSFETDLQGFGPNGFGVTISHDTIGATDGAQSMKMSITQQGTFVGALTGDLAPEIGDPPGMDVVRFDLTLTEAFPTEGFVDCSISIFGDSQPDFPGGQQTGLHVQFFLDQVALGDLPVGTHQIDVTLTGATHPLTFALGSFNDIIGELGSGPNDVIPTGFQIYINKSGNAPWTGYIDNIRVGTLPPPADADFNNDTFVNGDDLTIWKGAFGLGNPAGDADGDSDSDGADLLVWQRQLGVIEGVVAAVPEPAAAALAASAGLGLITLRSRTSRGSRRA